MKVKAFKITPVVIAIIHDRNGKFLFTDRLPGTPNDDENVEKGDFWQLPGGEVEVGETLEEALKREIREELGIEVTIQKPLPKFYTVLRPTWHGILFHFICILKDEHQVVKLNYESTKYKWFTKEEIARLLTFKETNEVIDFTNTYLSVSGRERS